MEQIRFSKLGKAIYSTVRSYTYEVHIKTNNNKTPSKNTSIRQYTMYGTPKNNRLLDPLRRYAETRLMGENIYTNNREKIKS